MSSKPKDPKDPLPAEELRALIARLRAIADQFAEEEDAIPLTRNELWLVGNTPSLFLEKCALFADATPAFASALDGEIAVILRNAVAHEIQQRRIIAEAFEVIRRLRTSTARQKLRATRLARELYRMAKSYATTEAGDAARARVEEMQDALEVKTRRRLRREERARAASEAAEAATGGDGEDEK